MSTSLNSGSSRRDVSVTATWYSASMLMLFCLNMVAQSLTARVVTVVGTLHGIAVVLLSTLALISLLKRDRTSLLSPLSHVLLVTVMFHGLGVLFYTFGNAASRAWSDGLYPVTPNDLTRVNMVVTAGLAALWFAAAFTLSFQSSVAPIPRRRAPFAESLAKLYFIIGFGAWYILVVPYTLRWTQFTLPGVVMLLVNFSYAAIFLMSVEYHRSFRERFRILLPVGVVAGVLAGLLTTSKTYVMLTLLFYYFGRFLARPNFRQLLVGAVTILLCFAVLTPFVVFTRNQLASRSERDLDQTTSTWLQYLDGDRSSVDSGVQWSFVRLNYVPAEAYAVNRFDENLAGRTVQDGLTDLLLPRLLFPDKPVRSLGNEFSAEYNNNPNNSQSPGIFAEAYWNGGWLLLVLVSLAAGVMLGAAHLFVSWALRAENWVLLPLVVGLFLGLGLINGFVTDTLLYTPVVLLILQLVTFILIAVLRRSSSTLTLSHGL